MAELTIEERANNVTKDVNAASMHQHRADSRLITASMAPVQAELDELTAAIQSITAGTLTTEEAATLRTSFNEALAVVRVRAGLDREKARLIRLRLGQRSNMTDINTAIQEADESVYTPEEKADSQTFHDSEV